VGGAFCGSHRGDDGTVPFVSNGASAALWVMVAEAEIVLVEGFEVARVTSGGDSWRIVSVEQ